MYYSNAINNNTHSNSNSNILATLNGLVECVGCHARLTPPSPASSSLARSSCLYKRCANCCQRLPLPCVWHKLPIGNEQKDQTQHMKQTRRESTHDSQQDEEFKQGTIVTGHIDGLFKNGCFISIQHNGQVYKGLMIMDGSVVSVTRLPSEPLSSLLVSSGSSITGPASSTSNSLTNDPLSTVLHPTEKKIRKRKYVKSGLYSKKRKMEYMSQQNDKQSEGDQDVHHVNEDASGHEHEHGHPQDSDEEEDDET